MHSTCPWPQSPSTNGFAKIASEEIQTHALRIWSTFHCTSYAGINIITLSAWTNTSAIYCENQKLCHFCRNFSFFFFRAILRSASDNESYVWLCAFFTLRTLISLLEIVLQKRIRATERKKKVGKYFFDIKVRLLRKK